MCLMCLSNSNPWLRDKVITRLRCTDGGGEYVSIEFDAYCVKEKGL
jgi:hypothetical protein